MPDVDVGLTENTRAKRLGAAMIDTALRKRFEGYTGPVVNAGGVR